jgi:transcriptional antiterminator RfaH
MSLTPEDDLRRPPDEQGPAWQPGIPLPRELPATEHPPMPACAELMGGSSKPLEHADARLDAHEAILRAPGRWWVLHTRARNEKRVASALAEHGIQHFLPLVYVHHTYAKAKATFAVPLFPSYVFLCGGHDECDRARRTNRLVSIIEVVDQDQLRTELSCICRIVEKGHAVELFPALQPGQHCRVTGGALKGLEGVVIQHGHRYRMYLAVTMLGQSAVVEVDAAVLEPVN